MKFIVKGVELNTILNKVIKGFNNKEENSYIAFELDTDGALIITSRSRAAYFKGSLKATSIEIGENEPTVYHLDGVKLKQLTGILPSGAVDIEFEIKESSRSFVIKTSTSKYKLPVLSETILVPAPKVEEYATVDANDLMKCTKDLIKVVSTDPATQEHQISCMHFQIKNESMKLLATDSYALGSKKIKSSSIDLDEDEIKDILIRHTEVATLTDSFSAGEMLTIVGSNDMFGYIDENNTLALVGTINLTPLDTSQIEKMTRDDNLVTIEKSDIKSAIETVAKLAQSDETVDIELIDGRDEVRISNRYGDHIEIPVEKKVLNGAGTASFATSTLLKGIHPANNGSIRLELGDLTEDGVGVVRIVSTKADGTDDEDTSLLATRLAN